MNETTPRTTRPDPREDERSEAIRAVQRSLDRRGQGASPARADGQPAPDTEDSGT